MKRTFTVGLPMLALAVILIASTASSAPASEEAFHLQLNRSTPAADSVVAPPSEIRLWFSQVPQAPATSLRVVRNGEPLAAVGALTVDPNDGKIFAAPVDGTLADGAYSVSWRTMAADGHVVRGEFTFTVRAP